MPRLTPYTQAVTSGVLLAAILALAGYTVRGFFPALSWAAVLGIGLWAVHLKIQTRLGFNAAASANIVTAAVALVFILPITWLSI
jgi:predicted PurR-regulated permease PerM